jgi:zinc-ribbon domain
MKFCSHCGAQLHGDERFCGVCGTPVSATPSASAPAAGPVPGTPLPPAPVPPLAVPVSYAASAPPPVAAGVAEAPAKSGGKMWTWIVVLGLVAAAYSYYAKIKPAAATPPATPPATGTPTGTPPTAPAQPGVQAPPVSLVQLQSFGGHWKAIYGMVEVTNAAWTNHSTAVVQSAVLECDQYAANGTNLSQMRTTLNGPVQPGGTATFNPFQMGAVTVYMSRVNCNIVTVNPASQ